MSEPIRGSTTAPLTADHGGPTTAQLHLLTVKQLAALSVTINEKMSVAENSVLNEARAKLAGLTFQELNTQREAVLNARRAKLAGAKACYRPIAFITQIGTNIGSYVKKHRMFAGIIGAIVVAAFPFVFFGHKFNDTNLAAVGSLVGGISLWLAAIGLWIQAHIITAQNDKNTRYVTAVTSFRALYNEFWSPVNNVGIARRWIISTKEYDDELKVLLAKRNTPLTDTATHLKHLNILTADENYKLDVIDQFLSVLVRIKSFTYSGELDYIEQWQRELWIKILHGKWWIEFIGDHRPELATYIRAHWKNEFEEFLRPEKLAGE